MKRQRIDIKKIIKKRIELMHEKYIFIDKTQNKTNNINPISVELKKGKPMSKESNLQRIGGNKLPETNVFLSPYKKLQVVDYDAVIIIASFDRYKKLCRILSQLYMQNTKYRIKVIICNDGSTDANYKKLTQKYPNIDYIENEVNYGKRGYWKTITSLLKKASEYTSHVVIQIDDDFYLCKNFLDKLIDKFFESKEIDNRNIAIHYHLPLASISKGRWGLIHWVDGGVLFDTQFLIKIKHTINPIPESRWHERNSLSSGVWHQVSKIIQHYGLFTYKLEYSLAEHDGNDDSKMNINLRESIPIYTDNFKRD